MVTQLIGNIKVIKIFTEILADDATSPEQKTGACTMIENYIRVQTSTISDFNQKHDLRVVHEHIYNILISPVIDDKYKLLVEKPYIRLIHHDKGMYFRNKYRKTDSEFVSLKNQ